MYFGVASTLIVRAKVLSAIFYILYSAIFGALLRMWMNEGWGQQTGRERLG